MESKSQNQTEHGICIFRWTTTRVGIFGRFAMADFNSLNRRDFVGPAGSAVVGAALAMNPSSAAEQSRRRYAIV
jgi:hypothetical protein